MLYLEHSFWKALKPGRFGYTIPRMFRNVVLSKHISWTDSVKNEDVVHSREGNDPPTCNTT